MTLAVIVSGRRPYQPDNRLLAVEQRYLDDGAAYERFMGIWSRLAGEAFLDWLTPPPGWRWIDIGCGTGAFTHVLVERCSPIDVTGIDPSAASLAFARARNIAPRAGFQQADALALPFPDNQFDAAVMALTISFVQNPARAVAEMARVVRPGGLVSAYMWDMAGGGFPAELVLAGMRAIGIPIAVPRGVEASRTETLRTLWRDAGLKAVRTAGLTPQREFTGFDDFWDTNILGASIRSGLATMSAADVALLKTRLRTRISGDDPGPVTSSARANAVMGYVR